VKILERGNKRGAKAGAMAARDPDVEDLPSVEPFEHLNQYFAQLPRQTQDQLFDVYNSIFNVLDNIDNNIPDLRKQLPPLIKKIFEICTPENVSSWVRTTPTIRFPEGIRVYETLEESAERGDQFGLRSRPVSATYLRKDYWGLVVLVVLLRMLVPVWGRFLANTYEAIGNDLKEIYALRLATRTALVETDGFKRLEEYVNLYLSSEKYKNSVIGGGVSKEDVPFQIMAILVIRRMAWVDFSGRDPNFSLVGRVYSFIDQQMDSADRQLNESIKPKIPEGGTGNDNENRQSVSETIKIKEPYTAGDLTILESSAQDCELFIARIAPDMPREILASALLVVENLKKNPPQPIQFTILQNVLGAECLQRDGAWEADPKFRERWDALFPPRGIDEMNLLEDLCMMAVATALLWHRGHHDIAALMTASVAKERDGFNNASSAPPAALTKENKEALQRLYPYAQRPPGKRRSDDIRHTNLPNVAVENIELIRDELSRNSWLLNLPKQWLDKLPNHPGGRRYSVKSDIRNKFAELAISIATRSL
jgi:hypothetical protein